MAEEFANILDGIIKKPLEEKIQRLSQTVKKTIEILLNLTDEMDTKMDLLKMDITKIKAEIKELKPKTTKMTPPPPPPRHFKMIPPTKEAILSELKGLFKKQKEVERERNAKTE